MPIQEEVCSIFYVAKNKNIGIEHNPGFCRIVTFLSASGLGKTTQLCHARPSDLTDFVLNEISAIKSKKPEKAKSQRFQTNFLLGHSFLATVSTQRVERKMIISLLKSQTEQC